MEKDSGTRSGLLWEVERILDECKELGTLPQILLMENVPEIVGTANLEHFKKWRYKLEELGYSNYDKILNAKDYGIPQNRRRCFMVSILGEYNYSFPQEISLKLKLKDMLEENVNEKYYLSNKMISYILDLDNTQKGTKWEGRADNDVLNPNVSHTLSVRGANGSQRCGVSNFICDNFDEEVKIFEIKSECEKMNDNLLQTIGKIDKWHQRGIIYNSEGISPTICSTDYKTPKLVGQLEVKRVGGVFDKDEKKYQAGSVYDADGLSPTLDTANGGYRQPCVIVKENLRIRKLTPRECGRLMGVRDEDITNMSKNQSDASLYHLFGDSIVVDVLKAIFMQLLEED